MLSPASSICAAARREVRDVSRVVAPVGPLERRGPLALLEPANVEDAVRYRRHAGGSPQRAVLRSRTETLVFATLQDQISGVSVESAVPNGTTGTVTVTLSKAVPAGKTALVGWMIVN